MKALRKEATQHDGKNWQNSLIHKDYPISYQVARHFQFLAKLYYNPDPNALSNCENSMYQLTIDFNKNTPKSNNNYSIGKIYSSLILLLFSWIFNVK